MSVTTISSLAEFVEWHNEQNQLLARYNRLECNFYPISFKCFFRGMSSWQYKLIPSIYRSSSRLKNEDKIIADCLSLRPQDFYNDKSTFERLVRMQHYGVPTRLLDVTKNPLVALYFAVQNPIEEIGKLTTIFVTEQSVKYADSDTVSVVSNIANMPHDWHSAWCIQHYYNYLLARSCEAKQDFLTNYNQKPVIKQLIQQILREKPYFQPRLNKEDVESVLCVIPPMSNERIQRQLGCFLLFGCVGAKSRCIEIIERESAELLFDAMDMLEEVSLGVCNKETHRDILRDSIAKFDQFFIKNSIQTCKLADAFNKILSSEDSIGEDVRNAYGEYFQQIIQNNFNDIISAELARGEVNGVFDEEDVAKHRFFLEFYCRRRAVFQTSVKVENKTGILKELEALGITKSYLFPELSSIGEEINARYPIPDGNGL